MKKMVVGLLALAGVSLSLIGGDSALELAAVGQNGTEVIKWYKNNASGRIQKNDEGEFTPNPKVNDCCSAYLIACTPDAKTVWAAFADLWGHGSGSRLSRSDNWGNTFVTDKETMYPDHIDGIAFSEDGSIGYVLLSNGYLNRFTRSGGWENNIWNFKRENESWCCPKSVACTADGKGVWAITRSSNGDTIWKSTDRGRSFIKAVVTVDSRRSLECIAISGDGEYVYVPVLEDKGNSYIIVLHANGEELAGNCACVSMSGACSVSMPIVDDKGLPIAKWQLPKWQAIDRISVLEGDIFCHSYNCRG